jgi:hypothetical protein
MKNNMEELYYVDDTVCSLSVQQDTSSSISVVTVKAFQVLFEVNLKTNDEFIGANKAQEKTTSSKEGCWIVDEDGSKLPKDLFTTPTKFDLKLLPRKRKTNRPNPRPLLLPAGSHFFVEPTDRVGRNHLIQMEGKAVGLTWVLESKNTEQRIVSYETLNYEHVKVGDQILVKTISVQENGTLVVAPLSSSSEYIIASSADPSKRKIAANVSDSNLEMTCDDSTHEQDENDSNVLTNNSKEHREKQGCPNENDEQEKKKRVRWVSEVIAEMSSMTIKERFLAGSCVICNSTKHNTSRCKSQIKLSNIELDDALNVFCELKTALLPAQMIVLPTKEQLRSFSTKEALMQCLRCGKDHHYFKEKHSCNELNNSSVELELQLLNYITVRKSATVLDAKDFKNSLNDFLTSGDREYYEFLQNDKNFMNELEVLCNLPSICRSGGSFMEALKMQLSGLILKSSPKYNHAITHGYVWYFDAKTNQVKAVLSAFAEATSASFGLTWGKVSLERTHEQAEWSPNNENNYPTIIRLPNGIELRCKKAYNSDKTNCRFVVAFSPDEQDIVEGATPQEALVEALCQINRFQPTAKMHILPYEQVRQNMTGAKKHKSTSSASSGKVIFQYEQNKEFEILAVKLKPTEEWSFGCCWDQICKAEKEQDIIAVGMRPFQRYHHLIELVATNEQVANELFGIGSFVCVLDLPAQEIDSVSKVRHYASKYLANLMETKIKRGLVVNEIYSAVERDLQSSQ